MTGDDLMNYHEAAVQVLEKIGGKENLISGAFAKRRSKKLKASRAYLSHRDSCRSFSAPALSIGSMRNS